MAISYKKLWKLLIDREMKKKDLVALSGISQSSVTKMGKNENVNTDVLVRIYRALNCDIVVKCKFEMNLYLKGGSAYDG